MRGDARKLSAPLCLSCMHLHPEDWSDTVPVCDAFPGGIPGEIIWWCADHTRPWPGDGGVQYECDGAEEWPEGIEAVG